MTRLMTKDAVVTCTHVYLGIVGIVPTQSVVTVDGSAVLVEPDPENRPIAPCPNVGGALLPCTSSQAAQDGYSSFVRIDGRAVCLETVWGMTNSNPPGKYEVRRPGQDWVVEAP